MLINAFYALIHRKGIHKNKYSLHTKKNFHLKKFSKNIFLFFVSIKGHLKAFKSISKYKRAQKSIEEHKIV